MRPSGRGGQPGTYTSTGMIVSMPCTTAYESNMPPVDAQAPMEMTPDPTSQLYIAPSRIDELSEPFGNSVHQTRSAP